MRKLIGEDQKQRVLGLINSGRYSEALPLLKRICKANPRDSSAWLLSGVAQGGLGDFRKASEHFRKSIKLNPSQPDGHYYLARALQSQGGVREAIKSYRNAVEIRPDYWEAHYGLARVLTQAGQLEEAIAAYQNAIAIKPDRSELYANLALVYKAVGRNALAEAGLKEAIRLQPDAPELYLNLGNLHQGQREYAEARACYQKATQLRPDWMRAQQALCRTLMLEGDAEAALEMCRQARLDNPADPELIAMEGGILERIGDLQGAAEKLKPLVESVSCSAEALVTWSKLGCHLENHEQIISLLEERLKSANFQNDDLRRLHFAVADVYHSVKEYDCAFRHYKQGNALKPGSFNLDGWMYSVDKTIEFFSAAFLQAKGQATDRSRVPVFIIGMPRTGSTLLEQILSRHSAVYGAGELPDMKNVALSLPGELDSGVPYPECLDRIDRAVIDRVAREHIARLEKLSRGASRVIDKMPGNYLHLGLIQMLFPGASVIHTRRDPIDTCLSCFTRDLGGGGSFSADLEMLGRYYRGYEKLMQHWKSVLAIEMHEVRYEELVEDSETVVRGVIEFCGLDWEQRCLDHLGNSRVVATPSYDQVRKPLYKSSVAKWKHYEKHLGPLIGALGL